MKGTWYTMSLEDVCDCGIGDPSAACGECGRHDVGGTTDLREYYGLQFHHLQSLPHPVIGTILAKRCSKKDPNLHVCRLEVEYFDTVGARIRTDVMARWAR